MLSRQRLRKIRMVNSRTSLLFILNLTVSGCTTIIGLDNPTVTSPSVEADRKKSVVVEFVSDDMEEEIRLRIIENLNESKVFTNVILNLPLVIERPVINKSATDYFPPATLIKKPDLIMKISYETWGFFEMHCIVLLGVLPCTPPLNVLLSVQIVSPDNKILGTYYVREEATEIIWAFGFLLPRADYEEVKVNQVVANMFNHILIKMQNDRLL